MCVREREGGRKREESIGGRDRCECVCEREREQERMGGERRGSTRVCEREGEKERGRYWGRETGVNVCV